MIEKIITSKTRVKLLKLFLTHIDDRYYLRELERTLDESLSPLRRQLMRLEEMGILKIEYEANLKYYRLNKDFTGIEELRGLVLPTVQTVVAPAPKAQPAPKQARYDIVVLAAISFFVLATAVFVVYTSTRSIRQVAGLVSERAEAESRLFSKKATATRPDEMVSRRWKVFPANVPVLSSGVTGGEKRSEEL